MTDMNEQPEKKMTLPVEWHEERAIEIPLKVRPSQDTTLFINPPRPRSDTTPPFRQAS